MDTTPRTIRNVPNIRISSVTYDDKVVHDLLSHIYLCLTFWQGPNKIDIAHR